MKIAIVNDLRLAVEALRRVVVSIPGYEVSWIAYNGREAVEKCRKEVPDLILMDLIMPGMDGVEATCRIMRETPCAILIVTATVSGNSSKVFEAMGCGALDAVCTPVFDNAGNLEGARDLVKKIDTIARLIGKDHAVNSNSNIRTDPVEIARETKLVAIASSTGGPKALSQVLIPLPANINTSIIIVQHVDFQFAGGLAEWLDQQTKLKVKVIREGSRPEPDTVLVAETNDHLVLDSDGSFYYTPEPIDYPYRPSANTFFRSLARNYPGKGLAMVLTGMGNDGASGLLELRNKGWETIAQDEASSVVYGMPRAAMDNGAARRAVNIKDIHKEILRYI